MQPNTPTAAPASSPKLSTRTPAWGITKKYRSLWAKRIGNFAELKSHLQTGTTFVSLDVESLSDGSITEIGMAFLPSVGPERPVDIIEFAKNCEVFPRWLVIQSQRQREPRMHQEHFKWRFQEATIQQIDIDSAEAKIIEFLEYVRGTCLVQNFIFVGFGMGAEIRSLLLQMPSVVYYISAWVDIQPIIWEVDKLAGSQINHHRIHLPSMDVAMAGFEFRKGYQPTTFRHCAGNDAVRILALFACLAHTPTSGFRLRLEQLRKERPQTRHTGNGHKQARKGSLYRREAFIEKCPFRAVLRMKDLKCPGLEIYNPLRLQQYFSEYSIKAIGQGGKHMHGHPEGKDGRCGYYFICFNSADELTEFVKANDQRALKCGRKLSVFEHTKSHKPVDRKAVASTRERNKENLNKDREDGLGLDFISNMENLLI
ncbi:hypothetical protein F5Y01DRAFT_325113 [Xylaria sp. FL0043]|nr:hypothetical protein F5Y01DRAFT_325113 [Xylaria sp. FL0043]